MFIVVIIIIITIIIITISIIIIIMITLPAAACGFCRMRGSLGDRGGGGLARTISGWLRGGPFPIYEQNV